MSFQTCYCCGWSKVTSYQGLRIHQGRMGCTPTGVRVAEPEQKCLRGIVKQTDVQIDLKLDVRTSVGTVNADHYSDLSPQVCHCGWTKMTTYKGLRIHQGKNGCTPNGMRIPETEQDYWKDIWQQEGVHGKRPSGKRDIKKQESFLEPPQKGRSINPTAATILIEVTGVYSCDPWMTSSVQPKQRESRNLIPPQVTGRIKEHPQIPKPDPVVRPKEKHQYDQQVRRSVRVSEQPSAPPVVPPRTDSLLLTPPVVPPRTDSLLLTEKQKAHRPQLLQEIQDPSEKINEMRKENMEGIRPTEHHCQVNRKHAPPVAPLRKKKSPLFKAEAKKSEPVANKEIETYLQSEKMNKEGMDHIKPLETNSEKSAAAEEDLAPLPGPITATMKVKDLARMFSVMDKEKAARPKETFGEKLKHSQLKHFGQRLSAIQTQEPTAQRNMEEQISMQVNRKHAPPVAPLRKKKSPLFKAEAKKSEPVAKKEIETYLQSEKMNKEGIDHIKPLETNSEKSSAAEEDLAPLPGPITATMKVKDLARMFSVMMHEEKAAWPKETFGEKLKRSQVKNLAQMFSDMAPQDKAI